jgi:hypothetical protein
MATTATANGTLSRNSARGFGRQPAEAAAVPQQLTARQDHIAGAEKPTILVLRWVLSEPSLAARLPAKLDSTHAESLPLE